MTPPVGPHPGADPRPAGSALPTPIGVVGLGIMGGSLARALAALDDRPEILGWSRDEDEVRAARAGGVLSATPGRAAEVAEAARLVVYAVPLGAAVAMLGSHGGLWRDDAVVTDVVSLKAPMVAAARDAGVTDRFVGSHPMAGSQQSGYRASRTELYRDADVWVATDTGSEVALSTVEALWRAVGARPRRVEADVHDRRMVWASHLPQLVSNALGHVLAHEGVAPSELGPGGRDMTRLAASSPEVWTDLLDAAGPRDARALDALGGILRRLSRDLRDGRIDEVAELMEETRRWSGGGGPR